MAVHDETVTGTVFDIQRFALHDGPGIRTAVFLKGCPLRCAWCCNPESQSSGPQLGYDAQKCVQCHTCVSLCPHDVFTVADRTLHAAFDRCSTCGNCVESCPSGALRIYGQEMTVREIMDEVLRDRAYYTSSGGGLTLSGGEPLAQPEFSLALLRLAREAGVRSCVETAGHVPSEIFQAAAPYTDLFLFDFKLSDSELHQKWTGKKNDLIMENLERLNEQGIPIILRCVLIPGINDHETHFQRIADLSREMSSVQQVDIMPYHQYGCVKYERIGRQRPAIDSETVSIEQAEKWAAQIQRLGGENIRPGV